jgi:hypothetical protein
MVTKMKQSYIWFVLTICSALLARIWVFYFETPNLSGDSFAYLNAARVLRGENVSSTIDKIVIIPRNETLGRPVYPIFLNLAFAIGRWSPTPPKVLEKIKEQQPYLPDDWHWHFFTTKENLKMIQLLQHLLGLLATIFAFLILWEWTKIGWLSFLGSLFAIGWKFRNGFLGLELRITTEFLATVFLIFIIYLLIQTQKNRWSIKWIIITLIISYLLALTRPNFIFVLPLLGLYFIWNFSNYNNRFKYLRKLVIITFPILISLGIWKTYMSISAYHFSFTPDAFEDPILYQTLKEHLSKNPNDRHAIAVIRPILMKRWNTSWEETNRRISYETKKALRRHPEVFLQSVLLGLVNYFSRGGIGWCGIRPFSLILAFFNILGLLALLIHTAPSTLKVALWISILNALICSIIMGINAEQARYALPVEPIMNFATFWVIQFLIQKFLIYKH